MNYRMNRDEFVALVEKATDHPELQAQARKQDRFALGTFYMQSAECGCIVGAYLKEKGEPIGAKNHWSGSYQSDNVIALNHGFEQAGVDIDKVIQEALFADDKNEDGRPWNYDDDSVVNRVLEIV